MPFIVPYQMLVSTMAVPGAYSFQRRFADTSPGDTTDDPRTYPRTSASGTNPSDVVVTLLPDRGFGDQKLYAALEVLGWDYVIRFRGGIVVEDASAKQRPAQDWVPASGSISNPKPLPANNTPGRRNRPLRALCRAAPLPPVWHKLGHPWEACTDVSERSASARATITRP